MKFFIETIASFHELKEYVKEKGYKRCSFSTFQGNVLLNFDSNDEFIISYTPGPWNREEKQEINNWLAEVKELNSVQRLVFGKDTTENIVSCEVKDGQLELFLESKGVISSKITPYQYWAISSRYSTRLIGNLPLNRIKLFDQKPPWHPYGENDFSVGDDKEAAMLIKGFTYFKGMKVSDVSVLAFDIESTSLEHNDKAKVLLISNTYRSQGKVVRKLFAYDDYDSDAAFFDAWCSWVREINPSIMLGHNIFGYDLPYIAYCASKVGTTLDLGRDGSVINFNKKKNKFRKDGSQDYEYFRAFIYGREIVDSMFLSYHYDFARKYESYGLKAIIKHEGLEVKDRQFYDAANIAQNYKIPEEWKLIKKYAEHDADDALALYDLMIPSYFYLNQSIPKSFQTINYSASGSQINSLLIRSYLQDGHSLPKASPAVQYEGAISFGNPGVYRNVLKVDVSSLYPSIMLEYKVYDKFKDPNSNFLKMVEYFTKERLENKRLGKETGNRYYKDLEQAQKIVINSSYGMLGSQGLLFNSPINAALVTAKGRETLQTAIDWATNAKNNFALSSVDTDSIAFSKKDGAEFSDQDQLNLVNELNSLMPSNKINWEHDGLFKAVLVLKAKNYVLDDGKKRKIKGSALKSSKTEKAIKEFMYKIVDHLLDGDDISKIKDTYHSYIKEINNMTDIMRWSSKKTITDKVINAIRTTEQKILDATAGEVVQMGDKIYVYFDMEDKLKLGKNWTGDHNKVKMYERLYKTLEIFENVLDVNLFLNYKLKRNQKNLVCYENLCTE